MKRLKKNNSKVTKQSFIVEKSQLLMIRGGGDPSGTPIKDNDELD